MTTSLRKTWLLTHRWLGLTVGLLFVFLGLTGSLLVFDHAIDEWLNPELLLTTGTGPRASLEEVIGVAEQAYAGEALSASKPRVENGVWTVWFSSGTELEPEFTAVYVDPYTLRVTGERVWGHDTMSWTYRLHYTLLAGNTGRVLVGLTGIVFLVSIASGVFLWWPLWKHSLRAAFAVRRGHLFIFDLHKTTGIVSAVVLAVVCFTGVYMEFPEWFRSAVSIALPLSPEPPELKSDEKSSRSALTADQAIQIAQEKFPHARWDHMHPPAGAAGVFEVALRQPDEIQRSYGRTQVYIDQYSGQIIEVVNPSESTAADAFFAAQFPLHNGEAFGLPGKILVLLSGLAPAALYVSGLCLWLRKSKAKRRRSRRASSGQQVAEVAEVADVEDVEEAAREAVTTPA